MAELVWTPWLGAPVLALLVILVLLAVLYCYRGASRPQIVLVVLRISAITPLLGLILHPVRVTHADEPSVPRVVVLLDNSPSMGLAAGGGSTSTRLDRARELLTGVEGPRILSRLQERAQVGLYQFAETMAPLTEEELRDGLELAPSGGTALAEALREVATLNAAEDTRAIVLLSDGRSTSDLPAESIAQYLGRRALPVHVVGLGAEQSRDLYVESLDAPPLTFLGDEWDLSAVFGRAGAGSESCTVKLELIADDAGTRSVSPPEHTEIHELSVGTATTRFRFKPDRVGLWTLRASIDGADSRGDGQPRNDQLSMRLRVVENELRVLYIEGLPRWEWRFLRNVMERDPRTRARFDWMLFADDATSGASAGTGLRALPNPKALHEYDVVILGDIQVGRLPEEWLKTLRKHIAEEGAGLLLLAGSNHTHQYKRRSYLAGLMPVDPAAIQSGPTSKRLAPTRLAIEDQSLFDFDPKTFSEFDGNGGRMFRRVFGVPRSAAKENAVPLLMDGENIVAAELRIGLGRSLYFGFDETWRWGRFDQGRVHERFWARVIESLGMPRLRLRNTEDEFTVNARQVRLGDELEVTLRTARAYEGRPLRVDASPLDDHKSVVTIDLEPLPNDATKRHFRGVYRPMMPGEHVIDLLLNTRESVKPLRATAFVLEPRSELQPGTIDSEALRVIAASSGGRFLRTSDDLPAVIEALDCEPRIRRHVRRRDAINPAYLLMATVTLLSLEWGLRRRMGMR